MEKVLSDYLHFLRFASVSADPSQEYAVIACAEWLADYLSQIGLDVESWETSGYPVIFATNGPPNPKLPTVLLYGHYDVQPTDPLDEWKSPPFEPRMDDGEIYARGAQDNKGQIFYTITAIAQLLKEKGSLPVNLKLLIEGEEEVKSTGLAGILDQRKEQLKADYLLIVDVEIIDAKTPAVTLGARGMASMTVELRGSRTDLHSGFHGGIVYNPNHALVELLAKLRKENGEVAVPGFYDDVKELSEEEKKLIDLSFDPESYRRNFGAEPTGGEKDRSPAESQTLRPTLEINGLAGGYAGPGFKTVIPAKAVAKISCRLVPNQEPGKIERLVADFLKANCPPGIEISVTPIGGGKAVQASPHSRLAQIASEAYTELFGNPCRFIYAGGSIPVTAGLVQASGAELAFIGMGVSTDNIHAPNEHFGWDRFWMGVKLIQSILQRL
jgi:acetylornithine deacetylase/succinyl-diaminopimelate desuccinylase-like protein